MVLSKSESETFAAIVAELGDLERRRLRRIAAGVSGPVLASALVAVWLRLHWPWGAIAAFAVGFVVGLLAGLFAMAPWLFSQPT